MDWRYNMTVDTTTLDLHGKNIRSLSGVALPPNLEELNLSYTLIDSIKNIQLPKKLRILRLNGVNLDSLEGIELLTNLQELTLRYTPITNLNYIFLPQKLQVLDLRCSKLVTLHNISLPTSLNILDLSYTCLKQLPASIKYLRNLKFLDLSGLELDELPDWLPHLSLKFTRNPNVQQGICLYKTTVKGVDMSIFDHPDEMVLQWFDDLKMVSLTSKSYNFDTDSTTPLNELKVVFLGDGEAGKTHTIARLLNNGTQVKEFRDAATPGIVIKNKIYSIGNREVKVHFWDFGGQEILHSMHRMFLTTRTLYVVMLNVREGNQDERARYWLYNLRSFADGVPVLLVLNKMDMNKNASVNEADLRKLYPGLTDIVKLSTLTDSNKDFQEKFIDVLLSQIGDMDILAFPFTASWNRLKEKLQNMTENYILGDAFRKYCNDAGIKGNDTVRRDLLNWFSDLGVSFCYSGNDRDRLEDYVVLRPDWITNAIYIILYNKVESIDNGLVSHDTIYRMLSSKDTKKYQRTNVTATYTRQEVDYVLKVFRKFRLSFLVDDEKTEFIPMLCNANTTATALAYENKPDTLEFQMYYDYLPNNVIHRFMVDRRKELDRNNVWLTGARFVCGDTGRSAVVKSEGNLIRILVRADREPRNPQRYLDELKESLERINTLMGLTVTKMEVAYKEAGVTEYFDYNRILTEQEFGEIKILSMAHRKKVLLADVLMQSDFPEDEKQKKLRDDLCQACEVLQNRKIYWNANEDIRTDCIMDLLTAKEYIVRGQYRGGISVGGIQSGELDLDIRLTPNDSWSALEALNLSGSNASQIEYWNAHLKKLLDNYNHVGRSFLFHVSYVQCGKDRFSSVYSNLYEHLRFYSPPGFELMRRFVQDVSLTNDPHKQNSFMRAVKTVYDCGGIPMTVYHFFVRIGE